MYYSLYYAGIGEEAGFYRREFSKRIYRREGINKEITGFLLEKMPFKNGSILYKLMRFFSPAVFAIDYFFHDLFHPIEVGRCQYFEIKNIEMYYVFLYAGTGNEDIINMLLQQKSVIENSVFSEI